MKSSSKRFLTSHVGSLPRGDAVLRIIKAKETGEGFDRQAHAAGMRNAVTEIVRRQTAIGVDIVVSNMSGGFMPKVFDESLQARIAKLPGVAKTTSVLMEMQSIEDAPMMMVSGREWGGFAWEKLSVMEGRMPRDGAERALVLGRMAAEVLKKKVGDTVQIEAAELPVVGIVDGRSVVENGAIMLSLKVLQEVTDNQGKANFVDVRVTPNSTKEDVTQLCQRIKEIFPEGRGDEAVDGGGRAQVTASRPATRTRRASGHWRRRSDSRRWL